MACCSRAISGFENRIIDPDLNNFAAAFGLAYQIRPTTVVRAAYGIFYDQYMSIFNNRSAAVSRL